MARQKRRGAAGSLMRGASCGELHEGRTLEGSRGFRAGGPAFAKSARQVRPPNPLPSPLTKSALKSARQVGSQVRSPSRLQVRRSAASTGSLGEQAIEFTYVRYILTRLSVSRLGLDGIPRGPDGGRR